VIAKGGTLRICNTNPNQMEKQMNIKRVFLVLATVLLMPGLVMAGVSVPGSADFFVNLTFTPDTGKTADALINCENVIAPNSDEETDLGDGDQAQFEIDSLSINLASCDVSVAAVSGYTADYSIGAGSDGGTADSAHCHFGPPLTVGGEENGGGDGVFVCDVEMVADDVTFTVWKTWDITLVGGEFVDPDYTVTLFCDEVITDDDDADSCDNDEGVYWCTWIESGTSDVHVWVDVDATGDAPGCWADESVEDSSVETDNNCGFRTIAVGSSSSCTIENTVFFEGIPTLNQYGLAIMALLMLGVGFVGFRRFV